MKIIKTTQFNVPYYKVVPAELSIAKISLREGIIDVYLVYIDPGAIPRGWRWEELWLHV